MSAGRGQIGSSRLTLKRGTWEDHWTLGSRASLCSFLLYFSCGASVGRREGGDPRPDMPVHGRQSSSLLAQLLFLCMSDPSSVLQKFLLLFWGQLTSQAVIYEEVGSRRPYWPCWHWTQFQGISFRNLNASSKAELQLATISHSSLQ